MSPAESTTKETRRLNIIESSSMDKKNVCKIDLHLITRQKIVIASIESHHQSARNTSAVV